MIESHQGNLTGESEAFLYRKAYEGIKAASFNYFGNNRQNQIHTNTLLN